MRFFRWGASSFSRCFVACQLLWALPMVAFGFLSLASHGRLNERTAALTILSGICWGGIFCVLVWATIIMPMKSNRLGQNKKRPK
jgi:hypothetical protein